MMSPKRMILLLIFYISYLMFGASIYYHIEHGLEYHRRAEELKERIAINEYILENLDDKNVTVQNEVLERISDYCGKPVTDYRSDEYEIPYTWTFYHSFFFAFTVCSTVGYGNISPTTTLGRMIMIVYSVIGIPINGILFAGLGEYFGKTFQSIYARYKKYKMSRDVHYVPPQLGLITTVVIALVPGITLFLLIPSWVFSYFEDWPYSLAFYYSYVTTTTIGFGDYVPTFQPQQPREFGGWFVVYQIFIIVWFIFSLGYLLMIMTFITRGLQSKKLARLEQQLSTNIKATQHRIWSGVTKDVGYLRRILNELYILKFKPVYTEPAEYDYSLYRSLSCPELTMYRVDPIPVPSRKRAFSECYGVVEARDDNTLFTVHASSDTELNKIDRQKSFESAEAFRQTTGLLAKVVSALATVQPPQDEDTTLGTASMYGGYHGFSDSQILASEWSFPGVNEIPKPRGRACSDFNLDPKWKSNVARRSTMGGHNEWTWSGDNEQIQEAINIRCRQMDRERENIYRSSLGLPTLDHVVNVDEEELNRKPAAQANRPKKFSIPDGFRRLFPFKKRSSQVDWPNEDGEKGDKRKFSVASVPEAIQHQTPSLDYYSTVTANASPSYFRNGKPVQTSNGSLNTRLSSSGLNNINENPRMDIAQLADTNTSSITTNTSYQRNPQAQGARKRRDSVFAQNLAISNRRASMFPPSTAAAALNQRRGSAFNPERRGSNASVAGFNPPPRRGSLFPMASNANRRPSVLSSASQEDMEVLENTTLADLIRALEVVHTQAVLGEQAEASAQANKAGNSGLSNLFRSDKKKRKVGSAGLDPPQLSPILSLFGNDARAMNTAAANRLYARRSTVVGTLPQTAQQLNQISITPSNASSILSRRRLSTMQMKDPPPSYSETDSQMSVGSVNSAQSKFKRRFSVRPTALQIPPGMAPPPGVNVNTVVPPGSPTSSQTLLQRRLSLRPSPLAQPTITATTPDGSTISPTPSTSSTARLLPLAARASNTSTHSPLSRIAQISQAQRKSSMPDGFGSPKTDKQ
ncbi:open rectifier potassium channel protein 1 [Stomoxys calcitrans]|uniref:Potassium channel domain-containing protein n=1 Tax=Stomoxys calcitrans TaxID=35570 RepID=A0A1I8PLS4_STOCA|nr:open rectifier potassium channel protein 1 [Stomoxys calcitrans]XP_059222682.1 open rectifier potassium channel protein 1 [Stomoxys calcitrans]